jgi:hypothetical protein
MLFPMRTVIAENGGSYLVGANMKHISAHHPAAIDRKHRSRGWVVDGGDS